MFLVGVHPLSLVFSAGPAEKLEQYLACKIMVNSVSMASLPGALFDYQRDSPGSRIQFHPMESEPPGSSSILGI